MALFAKGHQIAAVVGSSLRERELVVNLLGWRVHTFRKADFTQWVFRSIAVPDAFPCPSVPTLGSRVTVVPFIALGFQLLVFRAEAPVSQVGADGKRAGLFWFYGHSSITSGDRKSLRRIAPTKAWPYFSHYHNITYQCAIPCQSVPTLRWRLEISKSRGVDAMNRPHGHAHQHCNLLPTVIVDVPEAEKELLIHIGQLRDGFTGFGLQIYQPVYLSVYFSLRVDDFANGILEGRFRAPCLGDPNAIVIHSAQAGSQVAQLVQLGQIGIDAFVQPVGLGEILLCRHLAISPSCMAIAISASFDIAISSFLGLPLVVEGSELLRQTCGDAGDSLEHLNLLGCEAAVPVVVAVHGFHLPEGWCRLLPSTSH